VLLFGVLAALPACDSGGLPRNPAGIDFERLFAEPTAEELASVEAEWAARSNPVRDTQIVAQAVQDSAFTVYVVAHTQADADGTPFTHYGFVRIPRGNDERLPVLVFHHDGDDGVTLSDALGTLDLFPEITARAIVVAPVYRSEALVADLDSLGATYPAGGTPSPWDRDVDDAIGFLDAALALFPGVADSTRIGALGLGRGGNTALLHAVRDGRLDVVVEYYAPADFVATGTGHPAYGLTQAALQGDPEVLALPGIGYLTDEVFEPLAEETLSYEAARLALIRRSPGLFATRLTDTQLHHHQADDVIPVGFTLAFVERVEASAFDGALADHLYSGPPPGGVETVHSPEALPESLERTERFLSIRLMPPPL
jgi:hypothetical protein